MTGIFPALFKPYIHDFSGKEKRRPKLIINRISHFHELANTVLDFIFYDFVKKYIKQV
jgi:hypothetical protein